MLAKREFLPTPRCPRLSHGVLRSPPFLVVGPPPPLRHWEARLPPPAIYRWFLPSWCLPGTVRAASPRWPWHGSEVCCGSHTSLIGRHIGRRFRAALQDVLHAACFITPMLGAHDTFNDCFFHFYAQRFAFLLSGSVGFDKASDPHCENLVVWESSSDRGRQDFLTALLPGSQQFPRVSREVSYQLTRQPLSPRRSRCSWDGLGSAGWQSSQRGWTYPLPPFHTHCVLVLSSLFW